MGGAATLCVSSYAPPSPTPPSISSLTAVTSVQGTCNGTQVGTTITVHVSWGYAPGSMPTGYKVALRASGYGTIFSSACSVGGPTSCDWKPGTFIANGRSNRLTLAPTFTLTLMNAAGTILQTITYGGYSQVCGYCTAGF